MGRMAVAKPATPGPETNPWYWHPNRQAVRFAPDWFRRQLHDMDPELEVTWNPIAEQWQIWIKKDRIQHAVCWGWLLLFSAPPECLDNRIFARLYSASARKWSNGKEYFAAIAREMERDKEAAKKAAQQDTIDAAMPAFEHSQIKISMAGKSSGSKFATYHS
jgi:hypothetical protein